MKLTPEEKNKIQEILLKLGKSLKLSNIASMDCGFDSDKYGKIAFQGIKISKKDWDFIEPYWVEEMASI